MQQTISRSFLVTSSIILSYNAMMQLQMRPAVARSISRVVFSPSYHVRYPRNTAVVPSGSIAMIFALETSLLMHRGLSLLEWLIGSSPMLAPLNLQWLLLAGFHYKSQGTGSLISSNFYCVHFPWGSQKLWGQQNPRRLFVTIPKTIDRYGEVIRNWIVLGLPRFTTQLYVWTL